ncbi:unnamed protein product [Sphenostylis stenocarpa]|uniref:Uncharacterized protein n=1 Tax=Sphenostylis stenocarpa TaxID=92480 RepID=A0AA86SRT6_9FABA|nr:unnamed protein product [Sphenostylis stenocarpa]
MNCYGIIRIWDWSDKVFLVVDDNDDMRLVVLFGVLLGLDLIVGDDDDDGWGCLWVGAKGMDDGTNSNPKAMIFLGFENGNPKLLFDIIIRSSCKGVDY